jgi:CheY-like chemotaxis protein
MKMKNSSRFNDSSKAKQYSILVVEDDPIYLKYIMYLLKTMNITPIITSSGEKALEMMKSQTVDCMLIDNDLGSGMNGINLMRTFRKQPKFSKTAIIAMTPFSTGYGGGKKLLKMGFSDCLAKPFTYKNIKDLLDKYIS